jgi:hypothetical protein
MPPDRKPEKPDALEQARSVMKRMLATPPTPHEVKARGKAKARKKRTPAKGRP